MLKHLTILLYVLTSACAANAEILAKVHTPSWDVSVVLHGNPTSEGCVLFLSADSHRGHAKIDLKQPWHRCDLFGPVMLLATDSADYQVTHVFLEAARGGDGDHTGPIVEVYELTSKGFRKLGQQELFEASYHRKGQEFDSVSGTVLFSFCDVCDGPDAAEPEDNIFVPAVLTIGCGGICVRPALSKQEQAALTSRFDERRAAMRATHTSKSYKEFSDSLQHRFLEFLTGKRAVQ